MADVLQRLREQYIIIRERAETAEGKLEVCDMFWCMYVYVYSNIVLCIYMDDIYIQHNVYQTSSSIQYTYSGLSHK